ncbi:MAG: hypothetical protein MUP16_10290, partial [Sedimentisphaerales bacterium]|nr:hypothetical protein [Sedimentisphaerales bacterium]
MKKALLVVGFVVIFLYSAQVIAFNGLYGDFTGNGIVEMNDLPDFLDYWLVNDCNETNGVDLDENCIVNFYEFSAFANNWLLELPSAPTGLSATGGDNTVGLDWNDSNESDIAGYNIYRSTTSGSGYSKLNDSLLSDSNYTDNSVTNGTAYYYVVTAVDTSSNESGDSNEVSATPHHTTPPAAPTGLTATAGDAKVLLDWNINSEGDLAGYNIYRSITSGSGYAKINTSLRTSSDYNDTSVTNGTTYYYVVTAVDTSSNESGYSSQVSAMPQHTTPPLAPTGLTATAGDAKVLLDWNINSEGDLAGYNIYRSITS